MLFCILTTTACEDAYELITSRSNPAAGTYEKKLLKTAPTGVPK